MTPQALEVMAAWGFRYVSGAVWVKDHAGTGYWFRNRHELLVVGVRGKIPAPAPGTQWESVIEALVGRHSEKPTAVYEMIESYFPHLPKIEINARKARPGWDSWGLEAPSAEA
jgi:N6-adenosine-specific RNA methylase IME4